MARSMIAIITPTGNRLQQLNLCKLFMSRQTYKGEIIWIIVDDCIPKTDLLLPDFKDNWIIISVCPTPVWKEGENTQARNISSGIDTLLSLVKKKDIEAIFIIEDDDYYKPTYLERTFENLKGFHITGERNTIYYNVVARSYIDNRNTFHSSLFQTAFTLDVLPNLTESYKSKYIDASLWDSIQNKNLFYEGLSIGIKGMQGRYGIGAGHVDPGNMVKDKNLKYLYSQIGEDYRLYEKYFK
jgi:hypothetical protein